MSTSGESERFSDDHPDDEQDPRGHQQPDHRRIGPAPHGPVGDGEQARHQPSRHEGRSEPIDAARRAYGRFGHEQVGGDGRDGRHDHRDPEEPVVVQMHEDRAGQHDPGSGSGPQDRRHDTDGARHPLGGELVADDPEGEREHRPTRALNHPADEHHRQARGQRADQRPDGERDQDGDDDLLLAEHVADAPRIGVAMAALSRYAVSSQLAPLSDVCSVCSSWGMAGMIRDCSRANASRGGSENGEGERVVGGSSRHADPIATARNGLFRLG